MLGTLDYGCFFIVTLLASSVTVVQGQLYTKYSLEARVPRYITIIHDDQLEFELDAIEESAQFVLFQIHTQHTQMNVSLTPDWKHGQSSSGSSVGLVASLAPGAESAVFYVNATASSNVTALVMAIPYLDTAPMPGGCNMEFPLAEDPNTFLHFIDEQHVVQFAYGNLARKRDQAPLNCEASTYQGKMTYDLYMHFLPTDDITERTYLTTLEGLLMVDDIKANATKVKSYEYLKGKTESSLSAYRKQGVIYVVIVKQSSSGSDYEYAAYAPAVSYACSFDDDSCYTGVSASLKIVTAVFGLLGIYICFLGHRCFTFETFFFGFLAMSLIAYIFVGRYADWHIVSQLWVVAVCGLIGGLLWMGLWVFRGLPILSVLLAGIMMGYLLTALIFTYSPLGGMDVFLNDWSYGGSFACGVLLFPVLLLVLPKVLNIVSCGVVGSYLLVLLVDTYVKSSMSYLLVNALRKATIPGYISVTTLVPYQGNDIILTALWIATTILGITTQFYIEKDQPDFPRCPYRAYLSRRHRRQLDDIIPESDSNESLNEAGERTPLIRTLQRPPPYREEPVVQPL